VLRGPEVSVPTIEVLERWRGPLRHHRCRSPVRIAGPGDARIPHNN
jgi:hypothetical protein